MSLHGPTSSLGSVLDTALSQTALHGQLAWLELTEEKSRIFGQLALMLLGAILLFCSLLSLSALLIILCWDTSLRIPVIVTLTVLYMIGTLICTLRFRQAQVRGDQAFADTRRELAADLELMRNGSNS